MKIWFCLLTTLIVATLSVALPASKAADNETPQPVAVEDDVHEFMEYAFEPFFHALKSSLATAPKDNKGWKVVKANALILAENGNLLMLRAPEEEAGAWNELAAQLRDEGGKLYRAAKKRDYKVAHPQYVKFVATCNRCHERFADGEHLQKPQ